MSLDNELMKRKVFRVVAVLAGIIGVALAILRADEPVSKSSFPWLRHHVPVATVSSR